VKQKRHLEGELAATYNTFLHVPLSKLVGFRQTGGGRCWRWATKHNALLLLVHNIFQGMQGLLYYSL
jgi:hypothetical protein